MPLRSSASKQLRLAAAGCLAFLLTAPVSLAADHAAASPWVATWGTAMVATDRGNAPDFTHQTLRQVVHTSVAGDQVRVWLSNRFGLTPLHIGAAHIAVSTNQTAADESTNQSAIDPGTDRALAFHHRPSIVIPPGAEVVSDPVALKVPALANLDISLYFPDPTRASTEHSSAQQVNYRATGNVTGAPDLAGKSWPEHSWYVLSGVDVSAPGRSAVVAFGDSITDGAYATVNANHRWPDYLAARLATDSGTQRAGVLGVVDAGIGGNRVLLDGYGPNAVARVNWDVLARSGARSMIVLESINDIGRYVRDHQPYGDLAERLETGLAQLAAQAHLHGIRVIGATLTPYQGCNYYSPEGDTVRQAVNQWIRTSPSFDGVADFDKAVRNPANPLRFAAQYDSGDHLHPKDAGYQAMANSIDLSLLTGR